VLTIMEATWCGLSAAVGEPLRRRTARPGVGEEPLRLVDTLLVGAIIEARSCERFAALVPLLDEELAQFYAGLLKSEARHFQDYLTLARSLEADVDVDARLAPLLAREAELIETADEQFRFHSGPPGAAQSL
jgi:tRNA-(ms[2]io[6]A)-hydroxylase